MPSTDSAPPAPNRRNRYFPGARYPTRTTTPRPTPRPPGPRRRTYRRPRRQPRPDDTSQQPRPEQRAGVRNTCSAHTLSLWTRHNAKSTEISPREASTRGVCRILIEMADALFSCSWRIREQYGCSGILTRRRPRYRKGPVRCVPRHADANPMYGSVHAVRHPRRLKWEADRTRCRSVGYGLQSSLRCTQSDTYVA
jgi:hypothetical protein